LMERLEREMGEVREEERMREEEEEDDEIL
jgi:hypothetical protein